jgi:hypothetical protein
MSADTPLTDKAEELRPCPACPDGNEWDMNGPTGRACKVCHGHAAVKMNGAPIEEESE